MRLESFLMKLKVTFFVKKQRELEKNSIIFLKEKDNRKKKKKEKKEKKELKNISIHLNNFKKHFKNLQKYQYSLDYLFNEHNDDDYITEPTSQNNDTKAIKEVRELFNEHKSNYSYEQRKKIRKKLQNYLKEKKQNGSLTNKHKNVLKNITKYLKNFKKYNITYGLDYLFNEPNEDYYELKERVLLMVVTYYMKAEEIQILNQQYMNILT